MRLRMWNGRLPTEAEDEGVTVSVTIEETDNAIPDGAVMEVSYASEARQLGATECQEAGFSVEPNGEIENSLILDAPTELMLDPNNCKIFAVTEEEETEEEEEE